MNILIIGELNENLLSNNSIELITKAKEISENVFLCTIGTQEMPDVVIEGVECRYIKTDTNILSTHAVADAVKSFIDQNSIETVMLPTTYMGRDLAAFLSVDFDCPVISNAIDIYSVKPFIVTTAINGGKELFNTEIKSKIKIVVVRPKSFEYLETKLDSIDENNLLKLNESDLNIDIESINIEEKSGPQLEDSSIILSAGRGFGEAENLSIVYELAEKLHAAVGATRAIVDAGWVPYSQQVGQTGKTVKPDVYIACGISGATQHQVGMKDSKYIIAINKDEDAPIFQIADFGIVGDVHQVIPKLNSLI